MTQPASPAAAPLPEAQPGAAATPGALTLEQLAAAILALQARVTALETRQGAAPAAEAPVVLPAVALPATVTAEAPTPAALPRLDDPVAEIRSVLRAMFDLALGCRDNDPADSEARFEQFKELMHHQRKGSPLLNMELQNYKWRPLVTRARLYLQKADDPASFAIVQMAPEKVDARTDSVRVFLKADKRMPPPVTLRRDDAVGGAFRIETSSL